VGCVTRESLGLKDGEVVVLAYDPRWRDQFEGLKEQLSALGPAVLAVHHVGSTAVPGLCAKPILDVLVSIPDHSRGADLVPGLEALGFEYRPDGDIPDRHFFRRRKNGIRTCHLSLAEPNSQHQTVTLAFRDALRGDVQLATAYADLKRELARQFPFDRPSYLTGKSEFIARVVAGADANRSGAW